MKNSDLEYTDWFYDKLRAIDDCSLFLITSSNGEVLGLVCFDLEENSWQINYLFSPCARLMSIGKSLLEHTILKFRNQRTETVHLRGIQDISCSDHLLIDKHDDDNDRLSIGICSGENRWVNRALSGLILNWLQTDKNISWARDAHELPGGEICFYLNYGKIVNAETRAHYLHNLVVHASDLPKGKGWSPATWLILDGAKKLPVTLFEAVDEVDAGDIYLQDWIDLEGDELVDDWQEKLALKTIELADKFIMNYPATVEEARPQIGMSTYYARRRSHDSQLDLTLPVEGLINLLRVVDNENYPAFFFHNGKKFLLHITSE